MMADNNENNDKFCGKLEKILKSDNKGKFVKLLQNHPTEVNNSLVDKCVDFGATKCVTALLFGEVCKTYPQLDARLPETGITALAYVAHSTLDPRLIESMLAHCRAIPLVNVPCTIGVVEGLPIHFVLINLCFMEHLYTWSRGQSLIKLIILLCQWKTKPILDSACLLAEHTSSINEVAWVFLKNGGLKQFVALLLIAREKVLAPFDSGLSIRQYISAEIDLLDGDDLCIEERENRCKFIDAGRLLDVFESSGDDLSSYYFSMEKYVHVHIAARDVAGLLLKNEVYVCYEDLSIGEAFPRNLGLIKLGSRMYRNRLTASDHGECLFTPPAECLTKEEFRRLGLTAKARRIMGGRIRRPIIFPVPKSVAALAYQPSRPYSMGACQINNPMWRRTCVSSHSSRHLAHLTLKLIKGFRI